MTEDIKTQDPQTQVAANKSLYDLASIHNQITQKLIECGGEVDEETSQALALLDEKLPNKVDGYKSIIDYLEFQAKYWKDQAEQRIRIAKAIEAEAKRRKDSMTAAMLSMNKNELEGRDFKFKLMKANPKLVIDNLEHIPPQFKTVVQEIQLDNEKIKDELKAGKPVAGARLEESIYSRAYPLTSKKKE